MGTLFIYTGFALSSCIDAPRTIKSTSTKHLLTSTEHDSDASAHSASSAVQTTLALEQKHEQNVHQLVKKICSDPRNKRAKEIMNIPPWPNRVSDQVGNCLLYTSDAADD